MIVISHRSNLQLDHHHDPHDQHQHHHDGAAAQTLLNYLVLMMIRCIMG
jgi:hypothetical protein